MSQTSGSKRVSFEEMLWKPKFLTYDPRNKDHKVETGLEGFRIGVGSYMQSPVVAGQGSVLGGVLKVSFPIRLAEKLSLEPGVAFHQPCSNTKNTTVLTGPGTTHGTGSENGAPLDNTDRWTQETVHEKTLDVMAQIRVGSDVHPRIKLFATAGIGTATKKTEVSQTFSPDSNVNLSEAMMGNTHQVDKTESLLVYGDVGIGFGISKSQAVSLAAFINNGTFNGDLAGGASLVYEITLGR